MRVHLGLQRVDLGLKLQLRRLLLVLQRLVQPRHHGLVGADQLLKFVQRSRLQVTVVLQILDIRIFHRFLEPLDRPGQDACPENDHDQADAECGQR